MTRHSAHTIAGIVSRAGFTGPAVVEAVTLALWASSGDDAYDHKYFGSPLIHFRGLFALPVDAFSPEDAAMLYNPSFAAEKLFEKFRLNGYKWPPAYSQKLWVLRGSITNVRSILQSRTPSKPLEPPSELAQVDYHTQYLNGR